MLMSVASKQAEFRYMSSRQVSRSSTPRADIDMPISSSPWSLILQVVSTELLLKILLDLNYDLWTISTSNPIAMISYSVKVLDANNKTKSRRRDVGTVVLPSQRDHCLGQVDFACRLTPY